MQSGLNRREVCVVPPSPWDHTQPIFNSIILWILKLDDSSRTRDHTQDSTVSISHSHGQTGLQPKNKTRRTSICSVFCTKKHKIEGGKKWMKSSLRRQEAMFGTVKVPNIQLLTLPRLLFLARLPAEMRDRKILNTFDIYDSRLRLN